MKFFKYIFICLLIFFIGCQQGEAPVQVQSNGQELSVENLKKFDNAPFHSGNSGVYRYQGWVAWIATRNTDGTMWAVRAEPDNRWWGCGPNVSVSNYQWIENPVDVTKAVVEISNTKDLPIYIYGPYTGPDVCTWLENAWVYQGTHQLSSQDNNVFGVNENPERTNSWGWQAHGFVYDRDGNRYRYTESQRAVHKPGEPVKWVTEKIQVIPIGK